MTLKIVNTKDPQRIYRIGNILTIESLAPELRNLSRPFVLLLAIDATKLKDSQITMAAREAISCGLAYLCVWGPDCERIHDLFDQEIVQQQIEHGQDDVIMTTWHNKESLNDALWYFRNVAWPADRFSHCKDWIAVAVNNQAWADQFSSARMSKSRRRGKVVTQ